MCNAILPCIVCSIVTFVITTKILATHYFKMVDGYVEDMTGMTKEFIDAMKQTMNGQQPATQQPVPSQQPASQQQAVPPVQPAIPTASRTYTLDELAGAAMVLMDRGMQAQLQELLAGYGVEALPMLPPEQYGNFATALRGMGAQI